MALTPVIRKTLQIPVPLYTKFMQWAEGHPDALRKGFNAYIVMLLDKSLRKL